MTEINIILNSNILDNNNTEITKNDKHIYYEELNDKLSINKFNTYPNNVTNNLLNYFEYNDDYLEILDDIYINNSINIKKIIIKKILTFLNPIINSYNKYEYYKDKEVEIKSEQSEQIKNNIIIKKSKSLLNNEISLNYPINAKVLIKKGIYKKFIIPSNKYFLLNGFYSNISLHFNIPYKYNKFKLLFLNRLKKNNLINKLQIYYNKFKNNENSNIIIDNLESLDIHDLHIFYNILLNIFQLYNQNYHTYFNKYSKYNLKLLNNEILTKTTTTKKFIDNTFYNNYILKFNTFLSNKIGNTFNNNIYFSFYNENLLYLYENILIYSIDNNNVKNIISNIIKTKENKILYNKNQNLLIQNKLLKNKLELLTKKKFPNLFNPNSKEFLFDKYITFDIDILPKKYKDIILIDYKKEIEKESKIANNKCIHIKLYTKLIQFKDYYSFKEIKKLIDKKYNNKSEEYKCILCSQNLLCPHIFEYFNLLFSKHNIKDNDFDLNYIVQQKILNKFMSNAPINMIYYCKICGEELGRSIDLEQNIEYKDKIKLNTGELIDTTTELIINTTTHIVSSYIKFSNINLNITKKFLINYITELITFYINNIEKKIRKIKSYNESKIIDIIHFNIIIYVYASIIFIMTKYPNINFYNKSLKGGGEKKIEKNIYKIKSNNKKENSYNNIAFTEKLLLQFFNISGGKSNIKEINTLALLKNKFREAYTIIINTNNILINKLQYNKNLENIKELLINAFQNLSIENNINISENKFKITNEILLKNSSIFNYYNQIKNVYPLNLDKYNKYKFSLPFNNFNFFNGSSINKIINKFNNLNNVNNLNYYKLLNIKNDNKIDYLFNNFDIPNFTINKNIIDKNFNIINKDSFIIKNYNEYKYLSFILFYFSIKNNLYELPIYEFINNSNYNKNYTDLVPGLINNLYIDNINTIINKNYNSFSKLYINYIKFNLIIKKYELNLINKNILYNSYPYSYLNNNNNRYFINKNINLNVFICLKDGKNHKYNIYIFKDNNNKFYEIKSSKLDEFINSNINYKFNDYKCSKCNQLKQYIINNTTINDNNKIINTINEIKTIDLFYDIYKNQCPVNDYHEFQNNLICKNCKISLDDIYNKNINIYNKYQKEFIQYIADKNNKLNNILKYNDTIINQKKKENILTIYTNNNIINYINNLSNINLDNILVKLYKLYNINIEYLKLLGLTEGNIYEDIKNINVQYENIDDRLYKLINYIRTIYIYIVMLKNLNKIDKYYDIDFQNILNELKDKKYNLKKFTILDDYNINLNDLVLYLKIKNKTYSLNNEVGQHSETTFTEDNNKYIITICLKIIYNIFNELINININNELDNFIKYLLHKILKYDELFTNYNYAKLKQMFQDINEDHIPHIDIHEEDDEDDTDLFEYADVNIQFEDEELED